MKQNKITFKLIITSCLLLIIIVLTINSSLGRFVYNSFSNYILESQHFYFNSTILGINNPTYSVIDWDGVNSYYLTIDVNSKKNELVSTESDISYDVSVDCPESVRCDISKTNGVIYKSSKNDSYQVIITPIDTFSEGDSVTIKTTATSTYPYSKSISASYRVGVKNYAFSYTIIDSVGSKVAVLELTNSLPYYIVKTAFDSYSVGDQVSIEKYETLTTQKKSYCRSANVKLNFDPNILLLDSNNTTYLDNITTRKTQTIGSFSYVNQFSFNMLATSTIKINFFKKDINQNYNNNKDIIKVTVQN